MRSRGMLVGLAIAAAVAVVSLTAADRARATEPGAYQKGVIEISAPAPIALAPVVVSRVDSAPALQLVRHNGVVCVAADPGSDPRAVTDSIDSAFLPTAITAHVTRRLESTVAPVRRRSLLTASRAVDSLTRFSPTARSAL